MIDIGTTTLALARHLHGRKLTVITSSLAVVEELLPDPEIELVVLGGIVRRNYRSLVGVLAEDALRQLCADIAFLGASGIRRRDLSVMDTTMVEVPIKRGMIAAARRRVLLADAEKFSMRGHGARLRRQRPRRRRHRRRRFRTRAGGADARGGARVKIAVLGGGGFRVPMVYGALLGDSGEPRVTEVALYDVARTARA